MTLSMNWLASLSKFPEFFWGETYGKCISQLLLCNKQAQKNLSGIQKKHLCSADISRSGICLCWCQVDCSVHASEVGWRWTDLSGAWLNGPALRATPGTFHFSLQVCLTFPGPANYPGRVYVMIIEEVQEGRLHCKSQICVTSTKIPLANASLQLILKWRDVSYVGVGVAKSHGKGWSKELSPNM